MSKKKGIREIEESKVVHPTVYKVVYLGEMVHAEHYDKLWERVSKAEAENAALKARPMICEICGEDFEETVTDALEAAKEELEGRNNGQTRCTTT